MDKEDRELAPVTPKRARIMNLQGAPGCVARSRAGRVLSEGSRCRQVERWLPPRPPSKQGKEVLRGPRRPWDMEWSGPGTGPVPSTARQVSVSPLRGQDGGPGWRDLPGTTQLIPSVG